MNSIKELKRLTWRLNRKISSNELLLFIIIDISITNADQIRA